MFHGMQGQPIEWVVSIIVIFIISVLFHTFIVRRILYKVKRLLKEKNEEWSTNEIYKCSRFGSSLFLEKNRERREKLMHSLEEWAPLLKKKFLFAENVYRIYLKLVIVYIILLAILLGLPKAS